MQVEKRVNEWGLDGRVEDAEILYLSEKDGQD